MFKSRIKAFCAEQSGAVIIYVSLAMPVLIGGMGLGAETGYRYYNQRLLQHAADFAAHTGAVRKFKGDAKSEIDAAALNVAVASDYDNSVGTISVNVPPQQGAFTGDTTAVEVILAETRPRLLSAIFSNEPIVIAARAVAAATNLGQPGCILALSETAPGAVTVTGSTNVTLTNCAVASNSTASNSFNMSGLGSYLTTDCVSTSGESDTTDHLTLTACDAPEDHAAPVADPYYWVAEPNASAIPCQTTYNNGHVGTPNATTNVTPTETWTHASGEVLSVMRFCNGLDAKGVVNFAPGLYIVEGGRLRSSGTNAAEFNGAGVTFYFGSGGSMDIGANTTLTLSAPTTGPYAGILFFGSRTGGVPHSIQGTAASVTEGAIYMPDSELTYTGNSASVDGCTQIIANTIVLTGNSDLGVDCSDDNVEEITIGQLIHLVE